MNQDIALPRIFMAAGALAALSGCLDPLPPVNRVQENVVAKSIFEDGGEWYFLQTVIDSPFSAPYTFVGEQGVTEKIRWEVTEDYLIARRAYAYIADSEPDGLAGATEVGAAIAMYAIEKHFDIRREYNPVTGEALNVIVENDFDRPWHARDYMRVDWSANLITDNGFLVAAKLYDGIESEPVQYFVPPGIGDPHAPRFEVVHAESTEPDRWSYPANIDYIEIVNKMFVRPTTATIEGFGEIPTCFLVGQSHLDCAPGELTVRNSFLRVDPRVDYQPTVYTGDRMERFGYFVSERAGYDPDYGVVEPARFRFVNRHDLWVRSHRTVAAESADEEPALLRCTAANALMVCGEDGSVCDTDYGRAHRERAGDGSWLGACTLPYREREVRPVAYHLSANFPEDLIGDAESVAEGWNEAFHDTVASLRENECLEAGAPNCAAERERDPEVFVLCHNPVRDDDAETCGAPGTEARIGDLRYNLLAWVNEPHASSPLGYGPSSADPETGEIVMGNAFIYGAGVETLQSFARDILGLLTGDLDETQVMDGEVTRAWVESQQDPNAASLVQRGPDVLARVNAAMDFSWTGRFMPEGARPARPTSPAELAERRDDVVGALSRAGAFGSGAERGPAFLRALVGTDVEHLLTPEEQRIAAGVDPWDDLDADAALADASPLQGMSLGRLRALEALDTERASTGQCLVHADFADEGLLGLARAIERAVREGDGTLEWYGRRYTLRDEDGAVDYAAVREMVRHPIFHGVTAHEIGHTVGLRHNFRGSHDALNYAPEYWALRDDGDMRPRAFDPLTEAEIDGRIHEYQYSTVMDYGNNFVVTDAQGLGHYDHAAIKMGYGDLVEVFEDAESVRDLAWYTFFSNAWPAPLKFETFTGGELSAWQYTDLPALVGSRGALERRVDVPYASLRPEPELEANGIDDPMVDALGRLAVPYEFCSDETADLTAECQRYDAGADAFETTKSVIDGYWSYYIFNAYRRGQLGFSTSSYASRIHGRYFEKLERLNQGYALDRSIFEEIFGSGPEVERFFERPDGMGAATLAVGAAFDLLRRVITTPEPGTYSVAARATGEPALLEGRASLPLTRIDRFDGRALETTWNFDAGYYWRDQLERAGFYYDKALAIQVLVDPNTNFVGRDTTADVRRFQINFHSTFGPSMTRFFGGLLAEDWETIAPRREAGELVFPDAFALVADPMEGTPLDPNANFSLQALAAVYGMALIPETFDRSYFERARVWRAGGAEGFDPDPSVAVVSFTSVDGARFEALSFPDETGAETGPGALLLQQAQRLRDAGASDALAQFMDVVNLVARLSWDYQFGA
ncbi:MAG: zinc-dependent metalloprotease [Myxococcota bacterium]